MTEDDWILANVEVMLAEERHTLILARIREQGFVTVPELVKEHAVSEATIRRDLDHLASQGRLQRLRGGASGNKASVQPEQDVRTFAEVASDASFRKKQAIAKRAVDTLRDGEFIALDSGTTVAAMCAHLFDRSVTVATASLAVVEALEKSAAVELIVIGGIHRPSYRSMVGQLTVSTIQQLRFDKVFLGTSGVLPDGAVLDSSPSEVPVKQALLASAREATLLADGEKFPGSGLQKVCDVSEFTRIITDAPPSEVRLPKDAKVEVMTA